MRGQFIRLCDSCGNGGRSTRAGQAVLGGRPLDLAAIVAKAGRNAELYEQAVSRAERQEIEREVREGDIRRQVHDVKTPLTAAILLIGLLERKAKGQD